jgi:hypothetical protein
LKVSPGGWIGVAWRKQVGRWEARIRIDGRYKRLGLYESERDAALAYNAKAQETFQGVPCILNDVCPIAEAHLDMRKTKLRILDAAGNETQSRD